MALPESPPRFLSTPRRFTGRVPGWLVAAFLLLTVVVALWLPFGLNVIGVQEEWRGFRYLEAGDSTESEMVSRPLGVTTTALAHFLTSDSFVGFNLVMLVLFFGKGYAFYLILERLQPDKRIWALLTAILFVIFPADEGLMTMRALNVHGALFFFLLAVCFFLAFWDTRKFWLLLATWIALAMCLLTYEIAYPLVAAVPLLLVWKEGRLSQRVIRCALWWYLVPIATALYAIYLFFNLADSMTRRLLETGTGGLGENSLASIILWSIKTAYETHFISGWTTGIKDLADNQQYLILAAAVAGISFALSQPLVIARRDSRRRTTRWSLVVVCVGATTILLSILLYLPTDRRGFDERIYYFSSMGGALAVSAIMWLFSWLITKRYGYQIFTGLMTLLILIAMGRALVQHAYFADMGRAEAYIVDSIVRQAPRLTRPVTPIFVTPPSAESFNLYRMERPNILQAALSYLYEDYEIVQMPAICAPQSSRCQFGPQSITIDDENLVYDEVLIFELSAYGGVRLLENIPPWLGTDSDTVNYAPDLLINWDSPLPNRLNTMFGPAPISYAYPTVAQETFEDVMLGRYEAGQPVILETLNAECQSEIDCSIFGWLSNTVLDVPEAKQVLITPDMPADESLEQKLAALMAETGVIWRLQTFYAYPDPDALERLLVENLFVPTFHAPWNDTLYPSVTSYHRKPEKLESLFTIGDTFSLQHWALENDVHVKACDLVTVASWWSALNVPDQNYSMTLTLANADGMGITNSDGAPANILTLQWQPGELYYDERTVTIPCESQPGEYLLLLGVYDPATIEPLLIQTIEGNPVGDQLYLTTLQIGA